MFIDTNYPSSSFLIEHNDIELCSYSYYAGVELWDWGFGNEFIVSKNTISSVNALAPYGPIFTFGVQDSVISNNKISGTGPAALYLGVFGEPSTNILVKANNVNHWETSDAPNGMPAIAPIWLGTGTTGCTILGGDCSVNVFDEGTDNILVGVNNVPGNSLGLDVSDAMQDYRELRKYLH